jgi:hypothetical protein
VVEKAKLLLQGIEPEFVDFFLIEFNKQDLYDLARQKYGDIEVQFLDIWERSPLGKPGVLVFYTGNNKLQLVEWKKGFMKSGPIV